MANDRITPLRLVVVIIGLSAAFYFGLGSSNNEVAPLGIVIGLIMAAILGYLIKINK